MIGQPQFWVVVSFTSTDAFDVVREALRHGLTGQVTLHASQGTVCSVEIRARADDPGLRSFSLKSS